MSKLKAKGQLGNKVRVIELERGAITLAELKSQFSTKFGQPVGLRYKRSDGGTIGIYQDQQLKDAVKDAERSGATYLMLQLGPEGPAPAQTTPAARPSVPVTPASSAPASSAAAARPAQQQPSSQQPASRGPAAPPPSSGESGCGGCGLAMTGQGVMALNKPWHKECFVCTTCGTSLMKGGFHEHEGKLYCPSHYEEQFAAKCHECHKPIKGQYLQIDNHDYHPECFVCTQCRGSLAAGYITRGGKPYCGSCV